MLVLQIDYSDKITIEHKGEKLVLGFIYQKPNQQKITLDGPRSFEIVRGKARIKDGNENF